MQKKKYQLLNWTKTTEVKERHEVYRQSINGIKIIEIYFEKW